MKTLPIIFNAEMVRAILDGRKTQTRRVVKPQPGCLGDLVFPRPCPYGAPGDRLYVRETWGTELRYEGVKPSDLPRDAKIWFAADRRDKELDQGRWRPSIHMPRWVSRITLENTGVRVERVQDATWEDLCEEGLPAEVEDTQQIPNVAKWFRQLWDSINLKRGYSWASNPWVWVVEFKVA